MLNTKIISNEPYRISIIDSSIGGCSVLKELEAGLSNKNVEIYYFGDTAYFPYSQKTPQQIQARLTTYIPFLQETYHLDMTVFGCITATCVYSQMSDIERNFTLFNGRHMVESAAQAAIAHSRTRNNAVALLGTPVTIELGHFTRALRKEGPDTRILPIAAPNFAALVHNGNEFTPEGQEEIRRTIASIDHGIDTVILGCTHFSFLKSSIIYHLREQGKAAKLIDPPKILGDAIVSELITEGLTPGKLSTTFIFTAELDGSAHRQLNQNLGRRVEYSVADIPSKKTGKL